MSAAARAALEVLLARGDIGLRDLPGEIRFVGDDPVIASCHRYGTATAAAIAANAAGVAILWHLRSGEIQDIEVDLAQSVHIGLRTAFHLRQNGHAFWVGGLANAG